MPDSDRAPAAKPRVAAGPPPGALVGDAATILRELRTSSLRGREKDLLLYLFEATYLNKPRTWPDEEPRYGWVYVDVADTADEMEDSPGHISERLAALVECGVLGRHMQGGVATQWYWLTHPERWSPTIRGRGRAKALHTREDSGPRTRRERQAQPPMTREAVIAYIAESEYTLTDKFVEQHWQVVDAFQTLFGEPMQQTFIEQLSHLLVDGQWRPSELVAWMKNNKLYHPSTYPWGYLIRCLESAPRLVPPALTAPQATPRTSSRRTKERPNGTSAATATDKSSAGTGRKHGRFRQFVADADAPGDTDAKADVS